MQGKIRSEEVYLMSLEIFRVMCVLITQKLTISTSSNTCHFIRILAPQQLKIKKKKKMPHVRVLAFADPRDHIKRGINWCRFLLHIKVKMVYADGYNPGRNILAM